LLLVASVNDGLAQKKPKSTPAIDSLEHRVRADSNDAVLHYDLGMAYWKVKRYDDAERFLGRVRAGLGIRVAPDPSLRGRIGRILAARAAAERWGDEAGEDLFIANDADIRAALKEFARLPELLRTGPGRQ
jgi:hypothetical protein